LEARKSLDFVSPMLRKFTINGNFTLVESIIEMTDREYNSRKLYEKTDETIQDTREMAGQAPYIINAGLSFDDNDRGIEAGMFYNVKGPTLHIVGAGLFPDVYTQPFHSLVFNLNKTLGAEKRTLISIKASNLLNDVREEMYTGFEAENQYFTRLNPGMDINIGFKYSF